MTREIDVRGVFLPVSHPQETLASYKYIEEALERGALNPPVGSRFTLEQAPEAHIEVMNPSKGGHTGRVVIVNDDDD
jgi:NADPH:quinone reductase-like Zn-dependent oxidoreductase